MPRTRDASAKKEILLQTALELFAERGFHATTTKEIATRSGVAEGLIFYHFGGKKELLQSIIRKFSFYETAEVNGAALEGMDGEAALNEYGRMYLSFLDRHQPFLRLIWSPELINDETVSEEVSKLLEQMGGQASRILLHALRSATPSPQALEAGALMFLSSLLTYAAVRGRMGVRSAEADAAFIGEVSGIVRNGLQHRV